IVVVPAEDAQFCEAAEFFILDEVGEGDGAIVLLAIGGDEEKIARVPRLALRFARGGSRFENERTQDAAHDHDGKAFLLEVHEENAPRLIAAERAELLYLFDPHGTLLVQA